MSLLCSKRAISTPDGPIWAVLIEPVGEIRVGRARLEALRDHTSPSETDEEIVAAVERYDDALLSIFWARNNTAGGLWGFDPTLSTAEAEELARLLLISHLPTYEKMLHAGVCLHIRVDSGPVEQSAFRAAQSALVAELTAKVRAAGLEPDAPPRSPDHLHLWLVREMLFFFRRSFDELVTETLPAKLPLLSRRLRRIRDRILRLDETQPISIPRD